MNDSTRQPTEEELRAAYEAEIKQIRVEQIVLENVVTLINIGMRKTGLMPGTEDERDPDQVRFAIEGVRAHLDLVEVAAGPRAKPIKDALAQLQMAFVQIGGAGAGAEAPGTATPSPDPRSAAAPMTPADDGPGGPAQRSGRLWIPGQ